MWRLNPKQVPLQVQGALLDRFQPVRLHLEIGSSALRLKPLLCLALSFTIHDSWQAPMLTVL